MPGTNDAPAMPGVPLSTIPRVDAVIPNAFVNVRRRRRLNKTHRMANRLVIDPKGRKVRGRDEIDRLAMNRLHGVLPTAGTPRGH